MRRSRVRIWMILVGVAAASMALGVVSSFRVTIHGNSNTMAVSIEWDATPLLISFCVPFLIYVGYRVVRRLRRSRRDRD
jgi:uncharacterized membrane-anchored protein